MSLRVLAGVLLAISATHAGGEIHGTIQTAGGKTLTGAIRWDTNENFWDDRLDAEKAESVAPGEEGFRMTLFGWELANIGGTDPTYPSISIPFGELRSLEPLDGVAVHGPPPSLPPRPAEFFQELGAGIQL